MKGYVALEHQGSHVKPRSDKPSYAPGAVRERDETHGVHHICSDSFPSAYHAGSSFATYSVSCETWPHLSVRSGYGDDPHETVSLQREYCGVSRERARRRPPSWRRCYQGLAG